MKTFVFFEKNGNASIVLSEESFENACDALAEKVNYPDSWRVEDENGEVEEE